MPQGPPVLSAHWQPAPHLARLEVVQPLVHRHEADARRRDGCHQAAAAAGAGVHVVVVDGDEGADVLQAVCAPLQHSERIVGARLVPAAGEAAQ